MLFKRRTSLGKQTEISRINRNNTIYVSMVWLFVACDSSMLAQGSNGKAFQNRGAPYSYSDTDFWLKKNTVLTTLELYWVFPAIQWVKYHSTGIWVTCGLFNYLYKTARTHLTCKPRIYSWLLAFCASVTECTWTKTKNMS